MEKKEEAEEIKDEVVKSEDYDPNVKTQKNQPNKTDIISESNDNNKGSDQNYWPDPKGIQTDNIEIKEEHIVKNEHMDPDRKKDRITKRPGIKKL